MGVIEERYQKIVDDWQRQKITTAAELKAALAGREITYAFNSGKIENPAINYAYTRDIFEDGQVRSFTGDPRTLFEIQNLKTCQDRLSWAFENKEPLTESLVLEVQRILTQGTYDQRHWATGERPGSYKLHDYVVGVRNTGAPASKAPLLMRALLDEVAEVAGEPNAPVLTIAAYFHATFEAIHPFADGNGRTGRALLNHLLLLRNHPPITIYDEDRLSYFGALDAFDVEGDLDALEAFLRAECVKSWQ